jgi:Immunoglobulin I-set domain
MIKQSNLIFRKKNRQSADTTMIIKKFNVNHVGTYSCKASNKFGDDSKKLTVGIKLAPVLSISSQTLKLQEGQTASVRCDATGVEGQSTMKWAHNLKYVTTAVSILDREILETIGY